MRTLTTIHTPAPTNPAAATLTVPYINSGSIDLARPLTGLPEELVAGGTVRLARSIVVEASVRLTEDVDLDVLTTFTAEETCTPWP